MIHHGEHGLTLKYIEENPRYLSDPDNHRDRGEFFFNHGEHGLTLKYIEENPRYLCDPDNHRDRGEI